jgi:ribosomal protein S18 acetylase RimI-like enzyme
VIFRPATLDDVPQIVRLVQSAYRGPASRAGWTTEADLLDGQRVDAAMATAAVTAPDGVVLLARDGGSDGGAGGGSGGGPGGGAGGVGLVACCQLERRNGYAYFGMFAVDPQRQGGGVGRAVLAAAERYAADRWGAGELRMAVIVQRGDLIAWYERRGYARTGELSPFPYGDERFGIPRRGDLRLATLAKKLEVGI